MKHLVFVSKETGLILLKILLELFPDDKYTIIVFSNIKESFLNLSTNNDYVYYDYSQSIIDKIEKDNTKYDWLLNLWGGHIFTEPFLEVADKSLNVHPSLLPAGRGSDPVVWTLRKKWKAGCSLHSISSKVDEGPIWIQKEVQYEMPITGKKLYDAVIEGCIELFKCNWVAIRSGLIKQSPQNNDFETNFRKDLFVDRIIDVDKDMHAWEVISKLLAHDFSPNYESQVVINKKKYNAKLILTEVIENE